jgi:hypothetical protein
VSLAKQRSDCAVFVPRMCGFGEFRTLRADAWRSDFLKGCRQNRSYMGMPNFSKECTRFCEDARSGIRRRFVSNC